MYFVLVLDDPSAAQESDVVLRPGQHSISKTSHSSVGITLRMDQLAMELLEHFILGLNVHPSFPISEEAIFVQNLTVRIIDNDSELVRF